MALGILVATELQNKPLGFMINISEYLDEQLVCLLDVSTRDEVLGALTEVAASAGKLKEKEGFYRAIIEREKIISTGIGMGVAIPHAKLPDYNDFFIAVGITRHGIEWNSLDKNPVRLIFLIGGPDDKQTEYLKILSSLTLAIKDEERRKRILKLTSPEEIITLFKSFYSEID